MSTMRASRSARLRAVLLGLRQVVFALVILCCAAAARAQEEGSSVLSGGIETETSSRPLALAVGCEVLP